MTPEAFALATTALDMVGELEPADQAAVIRALLLGLVANLKAAGDERAVITRVLAAAIAVAWAKPYQAALQCLIADGTARRDEKARKLLDEAIAAFAHQAY